MIHKLHKMGRDRTARTFCGKVVKWIQGTRDIRKYRSGNTCGRAAVYRAVTLHSPVKPTCLSCLQVVR